MSMTEGVFTGADGTSLIRYYRAASPAEPLAILQILHGMSEYFLRYEAFAGHMARCGILVVGHDHAGHGQSSAEDDYGYFGPENGWLHFVEDADHLRRIVSEDYPDVPYFMLGHSMGSLILREYLTRHADGLAGAVITGTSGRNVLTPLGLFLVRVLRMRYGDRHRSNFVQTMAFGGNNRRIGSPANLYEWLSSDRAVSDSYANDPQCGFVLTLAGFSDLFTLLHRTSQSGWPGRVPTGLPLLFLSGALDPVGRYGEGPKEVAEALRKAGHQQAGLKLYEEMRHEVLNEKDRTAVYDDIEAFIEDVIKSDGAPGQRLG